MGEAQEMSGKSVIVTGGGKGVGRGITQCFLAAGADVVICGRNELEQPIEAGGRQAVFCTADVRDVEQIGSVVECAKENFGRLDILVNNAGGAPQVEAATASPRFSEAILRLNLIAPLNFSQQANAIMQEQSEGGCIINISSVSGIRPSPGTAAYGAAKAGLLSLTTTLAVEWAPKVRINAVTAGMIRTEQAHLHYGDEEGIAAVGATVPLGRMGEPEDVGDTCLYLASSRARYVTGANILLHGGGEKPAFLAAARNTSE